MTTSRVSAVLAAAVIFSAACADRTPPAIGQLTIAEPARPEAPLGVLVAVTTDEPARIAIEIADGTRVDHIPAGDTYRTEHRVPVVGLRPGRRHEVSFIATDAAGNSDRTPPLIIETDPLPDDFPPLEVTASQPDRMEPGATLLGVYRWEANGPAQDFGLLLAVDSAGEVVWYYRGDHRTGHAIPLANGNLLYQAAPGGIWGILVEIDLLGNVVRRWHSRSVVDQVPDESILVDVDSLHHDVIELPSGNFATLSTELRTYDDYPTSDRDRTPPGRARTLPATSSASSLPTEPSCNGGHCWTSSILIASATTRSAPASGQAPTARSAMRNPTSPTGPTPTRSPTTRSMTRSSSPSGTRTRWSRWTGRARCGGSSVPTLAGTPLGRPIFSSRWAIWSGRSTATAWR